MWRNTRDELKESRRPRLEITSGTTARGHFMNQNPCPSTDKTLADCPQLGEKQLQTIPAEKAENRFESRFE